jgi:4-hydroxybenzoate polyprenyltransferase
LIGNVIVSLLSAMVIFIVWYVEFLHLQTNPENFVIILPNMSVTIWFLFIYAGFAFTVTMIREIVKDLEDMKGDRENGCTTLPVVIGVRKTKIVVAFIVFIILLLILYCCRMAFLSRHFGILLYLGFIVGGPLIYFLVKLFPSKNVEDYHFLSMLCKVIMIAGILTMQLISLFN